MAYKNEHIRFEPNSNVVTITALNTGSIEIVVDRITLVNMTNQKILFKIDSVSSFVPLVLQVQNSTDINIDADLGGFNWEDSGDPTKWEYRISIITARGSLIITRTSSLPCTS